RILANVPFIESIPIFVDNKLLNNNPVLMIEFYLLVVTDENILF
ncbi:unnamed protein product, partial [Rotaria sordida]